MDSMKWAAKVKQEEEQRKKEDALKLKQIKEEQEQLKRQLEKIKLHKEQKLKDEKDEDLKYAEETRKRVKVPWCST